MKGQSLTDPPHQLSHCFGHTVECLRADVTRMGRSAAGRAIQAAVKAGTCRCEVMNPSGRCCLGYVVKTLKGMAGAALTGEVET